MELWKRACTIVNAERNGKQLTLQDDSDGSYILARIKDNSPVNLNQLLGVTSGLELIGKEVNVDLLAKKIYPRDGDGKNGFARYNFQPV